MPTYDVDVQGVTYEVDAPDENTAWAWANHTHNTQPRAEEKKGGGIASAAGNLLAGAIRGAGSIGSTILAPADMINDALAGKGLSLESNRQRRAAIDQGLQMVGANPESGAYRTGKIGAEIAGTMPVGGLLAKPFQAMPKVAAALESGGVNIAGGTGSKLANALLRAGGGAATGATTALAVNPDEADSGAMYGAAFPMLAGGVGAAASGIGKALKGNISPEVAALYQKAKRYGIDIPADRIANSRPLNALAATLNYTPLSGRAKVEENMSKQLARAISRTFGQDSDNLTAAWRSAKSELGGKFDDYLKNNSLPVDADFMQDLRGVLQKAKSELSEADFNIVANKARELAGKVQDGIIDGQAAYNIKKDLGRIGSRNSNEAYYANELKNAMVNAWDRASEGGAFKELRRQYGNMKAVKKLVQNGAEGEVSPALVGNLRDVRDRELQDLADISRTFIKGREGQHGAAQRYMLGLLGAGGGLGLGVLPYVAGSAAVGRAANNALTSDAVKDLMVGGVSPRLIELLRSGEIAGAKALPVVTSQ